MSSPADVARRLPDRPAEPSARNLAAVASRRCGERGHAPYLTFYDDATGERTELSYATFDNWASKTANMLVEELEVGRGDRVATVLGNHWTALVVAFACWKVGCCLVPLGDDSVRASGALTAARVDAVFVREDLVGTVGPVAQDAQIVAVGLGLGARLSPGTDLPTDVLPFAEEVLAFADDYDDPSVALDDDAVLALPGDPDRPPAGVRLTQRSLLAAAEAVGRWGLGRDDRVLCVQPAHATDGLALAHLGAFAAGASVVLTRAFDPHGLWRRISDERVTLLAVSPAQLDRLPHGAPPGGLRCALVASGADAGVVAGVRARLAVAVGHGVVEATCASTLSPPAPDQQTLAWLDTAPGDPVGAVTDRAAVAALDPDGAPLAHRAPGRLGIRGPVLMAGYDGRPDLDDQAFAAGWFATADRGFTDVGPDGATHVFVTGGP